MLYVAFHEFHGGRTELQWHVGEPSPTVPGRADYKVLDVEFILADGDELELILSLFENLPHTQERVQSWYGDLARTIWHALMIHK